MAITNSEITVIGGGVVGMSIALGLLQSGHKVTVLDGSDGDFRASHGNFGLIWLQGKGADFAPYANWGLKALTAWPAYAEMLKDLTGVDPALDQSGGYEIFTEVAEFEDYKAALRRQHSFLGDRFSYEVHNGDDLRRLIPGIGPGVTGATYSSMDGHVNPLQVLQALRKAVAILGGTIRANATVTHLAAQSGGGFKLSLNGGDIHTADRIVLCAGLGASKLTRQLGFVTNITPQRGELLITEKLRHKLPFTSSTIRQVNEGGVQIGGTEASVGLDDRETTDKMVWLARHAVTVYPALADVRVVRAWGALRVMTPDSYPVYAQSSQNPGAFLVTCHSGVTLSPLHATLLTKWIDDRNDVPELEAFDENRFALSDAA